MEMMLNDKLLLRMLKMIGMNKVNRMALMASLLVASTPFAYAMIDENDPELQMALQMSFEKDQQDEDVNNGPVVVKHNNYRFEEEEADLVRQVQEFEAKEKAARDEEAEVRKFANYLAIQKAKFEEEAKHVRQVQEFEDKGKNKKIINTSNINNEDALTDEQFAALLNDSQFVDKELKEPKILNVRNGDALTDEELAFLLNTSPFEDKESKTSNVNNGDALTDEELTLFLEKYQNEALEFKNNAQNHWTRGPLHDENAKRILRADQMPDSHKHQLGTGTGDHGKHLIYVIEGLSSGQIAQEWEARAEKNRKQMELRKTVDSSPVVNTKEQEEKKQAELQMQRMKRIQALEESKKALSKTSEEPVDTHVTHIINNINGNGLHKSVSEAKQVALALKKIDARKQRKDVSQMVNNNNSPVLNTNNQQANGQEEKEAEANFQRYGERVDNETLEKLILMGVVKK